jgi:hypothetical protein
MNFTKFFKKNISSILVALLIFCLIFSLKSSNVFWELSHKIFHDDSYYYMQTAVNYVSLGLMSFDRLTTTNGYHPLWMWLLISVLEFLKLIGISASQKLVVDLILFLGGIFLFFTVRQIISTVSGATMLNKICLSIVIVLISWPFFFNGMETAIAAFCFTYIVIALVEKDYPNTDISFKFFLFAVACLVLSRLDAIAILPAIIIGSYFRFDKKGVLLVLISALIGIALAIFQTYVAIGDFSYMPISSTVKRWWASNIFHEHLNICLGDKTLFGCYLSLFSSKVISAAYMFSDQLNMLWSFIMPEIIYASSAIFPKTLISIANMLAIATIVSFYVKKLQAVRGKTVLLISVTLIFSGYFLFLTTFLFSFQVRSFSWYLWSCLPFLYISYVNLRIFRTPFMSASLIIILLVGTYQIIFKSVPSEWAKGYQAVANIINMDNDLHIGGTWAAGHIGFATNGKVINLEGLISGSGVHKANENQQLARYIIDNDLDFLIYNSKLPNSTKGIYFFDFIRVKPLLELKPCLSEIKAYDNGDDVTIFFYKIDKPCAHHLAL